MNTAVPDAFAALDSLCSDLIRAQVKINALRSANAYLHRCITQDATYIDNALQTLISQAEEILRLRAELASARAQLARVRPGFSFEPSAVPDRIPDRWLVS